MSSEMTMLLSVIANGVIAAVLAWIAYKTKMLENKMVDNTKITEEVVERTHIIEQQGDGIRDALMKATASAARMDANTENIAAMRGIARDIDEAATTAAHVRTQLASDLATTLSTDTARSADNLASIAVDVGEIKSGLTNDNDKGNFKQ